MDLDRAAQQLAVLLRVPAVERGRGAVVHRDDRGVVAREAEPLGVHRGDLGLGELPREVARAPELADRGESRGDQLGQPTGDLHVVRALARWLLALDRREGVAVGLELGVGELLDELADLAQLHRQLGVQRVGAGQHVLECLVAQLDGGVLHRDQVLDLVVQALPDHPPAAGVRRVQQRRDEPVALVEVGLPVQCVVLVGPRDVPHGGTREGHRGVAGLPWRAARTRRRPT